MEEWLISKMTRLYFEDPSCQLYLGDAREVLRQLPEESINCVVTSPPFWGLRKYAGEQEVVWSGDGKCKHQWNMEIISTETFARGGHVPDYAYGQPYRSTRPELWQRVEHKRGFCSICGAIKCALGLEPDPSMYIGHLIQLLREIKRVLCRDGVCFIHLDDTRASHPGDRAKVGGFQANPSKDRAEAESPMAMRKYSLIQTYGEWT